VADRKIKGHTDQTTKEGYLYLKNKTRYIKTPYSLLRSKDFISLEPMALKIYWLIIRLWNILEPDEPVEVTYETLREHCKRRKPNGEGSTKVIYPSNSTIAKAIINLERLGFIYKDTRHKNCNRYWVEQKWFTGEYK
jgi:hypothetical protein